MIDEKKLIVEIEKRKNLFTEKQMDLLKYLIEKQPKIGEWIPCSERLPKKNDDYLVSYRDSRYGKIRYSIGIDFYNDYFKSFNREQVISDLHVVAWQPSLEPYKEVGGMNG